jgi:SAM-dependent methyltransferase
MQKSICPLCQTKSALFINFKTRLYYECPTCKGIFMDPSQYMSFENEKKHYSHHNNDVDDKGYQNFVSPITSSILKDYTSKHKGLDFGAGTGSAISKILTDNHFQIWQYDPYFHNYPELLEAQYDYIACCEVVEHFHHPDKDFKLLHHLLLPKGRLFIMTHLYDPTIDFENWYYKNDTTHVFIYQKETMLFIKSTFEFADVQIQNRLIVFTK